MNKTEHLLACLAEECAEVAQAVGKALRFGLEDGYPRSQTTNADDIAKELNDVLVIAQMLRDCDAIPTRPLAHDAGAKKAKVEQYMRYAEDRGTLTPNVELSGDAPLYGAASLSNAGLAGREESE